jgi:hypothetical protein
VKPLYGACWERIGDRDVMTDELGHRRHSSSVPCFLGGDRHSWRVLGIDVRFCRTVEISACVYDGRERSRPV